MGYLDTHTRTTSPTKNDLMQPGGRMPALFGVFVGFIKDAADVQRNGRLRVWVPELGSAPDNPDGWIIVSYCSPFAGATNVETASVGDTKSFEGTQTSYGMWMIPPDINNQVLIMFINGDPSRGIWIGSLYNQFMNNMVPGMAADTNNYQYPGKNIPVAEYNKTDTKVNNPSQATKPYEGTKFKGLGNQGLITDTERGVTTSSARRESPSQVFGIITPGPVIKDSVDTDKIRRKGGSSFIMDDKEGSEYVQFTTKSGAQININETTGFIYLINRDGTAWVQMDYKGNVDIFGARNISMRAQRDVNIRADRNINIEAGQNIFMKAAKDTKEETVAFTYDVNNVPNPSIIPVWNYKGEGKGDGGNIVMQALNNWQSTTQKSAFLTVVENNLDVKIGNALSVTTQRGGQDYNAKLGIKITTNAAIDVGATGNIRVGSKGSVNVVGVSNVVVCSDSNISLNASNSLITASGNKTSMHATTIEMDANVNINNLSTLSIKSNTLTRSPGEPIGGGNANIPAADNTISAEGALSSSTAKPAEVKPLNDKLNILATWKTTATYFDWNISTFYRPGNVVNYKNKLYIANKEIPASEWNRSNWDVYIPEEKFKRNAKSIQTTVSTFPTYEPCPEHDAFRISSVSGFTPVITPDDKTYAGSGAVGNTNTGIPAPAINLGANNTSIQGDPPADSSVSKDLNINALRCQLIIHEGLKNRAYADNVNKVTGGIGHLMRANELASFPLGTPISAEQIETWYVQDSASAIKIAQQLFPDIWGDLSDIRKRALTDLCYNLGKNGVSKFVKFCSAMNAKNFDKAGMELKDSTWFNQVGKRGPNIVAMIVNNIDPNGCDKKFPGY